VAGLAGDGIRHENDDQLSEKEKSRDAWWSLENPREKIKPPDGGFKYCRYYLAERESVRLTSNKLQQTPRKLTFIGRF